MKGIDSVVDRCDWVGDCLVWSGAKGNGYGMVSLDGRSHRVHRLIYAETVGEIPAGYLVRHDCDNPPCCNPEHLKVGTHADNTKDRQVRDRHPYPQREWTHCHRGHEYNEENTQINASGARVCLPCRRGIASGKYQPWTW